MLSCPRCGAEYEAHPLKFSCEKCGELLDALLRISELDWEGISEGGPGIWRYRELLPRVEHIVSLGEGNTPLIPLAKPGGRALAKFEGANPTGSFKDRGMAVGVSVAKSIGARATIVASTGNTAASVAAYSTRAGLECLVVLPRGGVARRKLAQAILHGARIVEVEGSFDDALRSVLRAL